MQSCPAGQLHRHRPFPLPIACTRQNPCLCVLHKRLSTPPKAAYSDGLQRDSSSVGDKKLGGTKHQGCEQCVCVCVCAGVCVAGALGGCHGEELRAGVAVSGAGHAGCLLLVGVLGEWGPAGLASRGGATNAPSPCFYASLSSVATKGQGTQGGGEPGLHGMRTRLGYAQGTNGGRWVAAVALPAPRHALLRRCLGKTMGEARALGSWQGVGASQPANRLDEAPGPQPTKLARSAREPAVGRARVVLAPAGVCQAL